MAVNRKAQTLPMNDLAADNRIAPPGQQPRPNQTPRQLRVVLLADDETLGRYGPVMRRLAVGLIDELSDLTLLTIGHSAVAGHVPSPPVRLVVERPSCHQPEPRPDISSHQTTITTSKYSLVNRLFRRRRVKQLAAALAQSKPTLLHALSERESPLARQLSKQLRIPYIVSLLSGPGSDLDLSLSRERCCGVLPCAASLTRQLRRRNASWAWRIRLIPLGTHVTESPCCFSGTPGITRLFCCSEFGYSHGLTELIHSVKKLSDSASAGRVELVLSGAGPAEHYLRQRVQQLGLVEQVHFVPPVNTMISASDAYKAALQSADIFVRPGPSHSWSPELLEAMAVGNAVVVAGDQICDCIVNGKTALVAPNKNEQALTEALSKLIEDRPLARQLAQAGQDYLRRHFLASSMISRLVAAYRQALAPSS